MAHKMSILYQDEDCYIIKCDDCSRKIAFFIGEHPKYYYMDKGDFYQTHDFSVGGVSVEFKDVIQEEDKFNPYDPETYEL